MHSHDGHSKDEKITGTNGDDHIIYTGTESGAGLTGIKGAAGDDTIEGSCAWGGQIHMWGARGDDTFILDMTNYEGHQGHHVYGGAGADTFNFTNVSDVDSPVAGRIDDFDPTEDRILIDGTEVRLEDLEDGSGTVNGVSVQIVEYQSIDAEASGLASQQFLVLDNMVFYALEGARMTPDGGEEQHFTEVPQVGDYTVTEYISPNDFVPVHLYSDIHFAESRSHFTKSEYTGSFKNECIISAASSDGSQLFEMHGGSDVVNAYTGYDTVYGGSGSDFISGGLDDDVLYGDAQADHVWGGSGHDTVYGGDGRDNLFGDFGEDLVYSGRGADDIRGGSGDDKIYGDDGTDSIAGNDGDDVIYGNAGHDTMRGHEGDDIIKGGNGNDVLIGGMGHDRLVGGNGDDDLTGQAGGDTYVFVNNFGDDVIQDFDSGSSSDVIDLNGVDAITSYNDLTNNHLSTVSGNAVIQDGGNTITLVGVSVVELESSDFLF